MVGLSEKDLCLFIKHNQCYNRFKKLENITHFLDKIEKAGLSKLLFYSIKHGSNDKRIVEDILDKSTMAVDKILNNYYLTSPLPRLELFDMVQDRFFDNELYKIFLKQSNFQEYQLAKHIYHARLKEKDFMFEISKLPIEIIEFLRLEQAEIYVGSLPPLHYNAIDFILAFPYDKEKVEYDFKKAFTMGNIKVLTQMFLIDHDRPSVEFLNCSMCTCPNIETFDFMIKAYGQELWPTLEFTVLHDLDLVKEIINRDFKFSSISLSAKYDILEFLVQNNYLENVDFVGRYHNTFHDDIRVVKLLFQKYQSDFKILPFYTSTTPEIIKYCLDIGCFDSNFPDDLIPFFHLDVFIDIFNRLCKINLTFKNFFVTNREENKERLGLLWMAYQSSSSFKRTRIDGFFKDSEKTLAYFNLIRQTTGKHCLFDLFAYSLNGIQIHDYINYNTLFPFQAPFSHQLQILDGYDGDFNPLLFLLHDSMHYTVYKLTFYIQQFIKKNFDPVKVTRVAFKYFTGEYEFNILNQKSKLIGSFVLEPFEFLDIMVNDPTIKISISFLQNFINYHLNTNTFDKKSNTYWKYIQLLKSIKVD
ncbi:hypothetical protein CYY_007378 [Polysphondylium violaceum]|uniref:Uncharacterized protein n=1 Tax=Polysphondylium violaceum TaxID=133409 RepID=A0A8J4PPT5_9MYCE|nr:hypothetical protein CYY_007378 [Polysphondylium violaceum]